MIKTRDIRPEEAHRRYMEMFAEQKRRYVDDSGQLHSEYAVTCDCPICDSPDRMPFDPPSPYQICASCGCVYASPRLRDDVIDDLARQSPALQFFHEHILLPTSPKRREGVFAPSLDLIRGHVPENGRVLELGCAVGTFLDLLQDAGFRAEGIELCRFSVEHCRSLGHMVHNTPIEQMRIAESSFDAVCAWGVFGHLTRLRDTVKAACRTLRPGGLLAFTATNIASFEYMLLRSRIMNPLLRYVYYTPGCTRRLLAEAGFTAIEISTPGQTDVQTVRDTLNPESDALDPFHHDLLFSQSHEADRRRDSFQRWLGENNRSGYMLVTAKKSG